MPQSPTLKTQDPAPDGDQVASLKAQLRHAQKLAVLGTTSTMLAHEYNNIFSPIVSYAQYALDQDDIVLMRKALEIVLRQFESIQSLSDRVMGLVRDDNESMAKTNLKAVIDDAVGCLGRDLEKDHISLTVSVDENIHVLGNHNQLQHVFFNLVLNARQAMADRRGRMKIEAIPISDERISIMVKDNGKGISGDDQKRIFDPFFSTKQAEKRQDRKGLGLGLAICRDIVKEHGGDIHVESAVDHGTSFTITLPLIP